MFENMDFSKMGELLNQVQEKAKNIELELANREFSAKSGAGLVKVSANGKGEIIDVSLALMILYLKIKNPCKFYLFLQLMMFWLWLHKIVQVWRMMF